MLQPSHSLAAMSTRAILLRRVTRVTVTPNQRLSTNAVHLYECLSPPLSLIYLSIIRKECNSVTWLIKPLITLPSYTFHHFHSTIAPRARWNGSNYFSQQT